MMSFPTFALPYSIGVNETLKKVPPLQVSQSYFIIELRIPDLGITVNSEAESYVNSAVNLSPVLMSLSNKNLTLEVKFKGEVISMVSSGSGSVDSSCTLYLD